MKGYFVRPPAGKGYSVPANAEVQSDFDASPLTNKNDNDRSDDFVFSADTRTVLKYIASRIGEFNPQQVRV